jgi:hypothetical protein
MSTLAKTNDPANGLKVRGCCVACAKSKVRCTKERPSCSRCESKSIECRYLHCKRPGRVPGSGARRTNSTSTGTDQTKSQVVGTADAARQLDPPSSPSPSPHARSTAASLLLSPASTTHPPDRAQCRAGAHHRVDSFQTQSAASDALPSDLFPTFNLDSAYGVWDDCLDTLASIDAPMYTDLMDWDPSATTMPPALPLDPGSGLGLDMLDGSNGSQSPASRLLPFELLMPSASTSSTEASSRASSSESLSSECTAPTSLSSSSSSSRHASLPRDVALTALPGGQSCSQPARLDVVNATASKADNGTSCNCLDKALDLFKAITKNPCSDPSSASGSPLTQHILSKNKETIQAMLGLVNCRNCSEDRMLIMVALLMTMRMLSWYASAAALTGGAGGGTGIDDGPKTSRHGTLAAMGRHQPCHRQAKQQVLRELHSVQRLITSLSARLKGLESRYTDSGPDAALGQPRSASREPERSHDGRKRTMSAMSLQPNVVDTPAMPISTRTLEAVEVDARSSLGWLSAAVRNALKES